MKIGILGGTFNPIHNGHIMLAKAAIEEMNLDLVYFMPTGKSYLKKDIYIPDGQIRGQMISLALKGHEKCELDLMEVKRGGNTYTYETLQVLHNRQEAQYYFIGGADTLFSIEMWKKPEIIFELCTLLISVRGEVREEDLRLQINHLREKFGAKVEIIHMDAILISSSMIRDRIMKKEDVSDLVPPEVLSYINENRIYG